VADRKNVDNSSLLDQGNFSWISRHELSWLIFPDRTSLFCTETK
jgi:hypothetical protein